MHGLVCAVKCPLVCMFLINYLINYNEYVSLQILLIIPNSLSDIPHANFWSVHWRTTGSPVHLPCCPLHMTYISALYFGMAFKIDT